MNPPSDLRRRAAAAAALGGFLSLLAMFAFLVVPGLPGRAGRLPDAGARVDTGWLDPTDYPAERGGPAPQVDPRELLDPGPETLAKARETYARLCASCHGDGGHGDGPGGRGLTPPPRDFTRPGGWHNGSGLAGVYRTLETGVPGSAMNAYKFLTRKERVALARVVLGFGGFAREGDGRADLARALAAPVEDRPNLIPVRRAMVILSRNDRPPAPLAGGGAAVADPVRAAGLLRARSGWKAGDAAFLAAVAPQVQDNGFAPGVLLLSPARRRRLLEDLR